MLGCGSNIGYVYGRGGRDLVGELTGVTTLTYSRVRDDVSAAQWTMQTDKCCDLLSRIGTVVNELHVYRDSGRVWRGVITRIEWGHEESRVFAQDMLWPQSRMALTSTLNFRYPNIALVCEQARFVLESGYALGSDFWGMANKVHWVRSPEEPRTSLVIPAYSATRWDVLDRWAEDGGIDYTVVDDQVYVFDTHLAWKQNAALTPEDMGGPPEVVEYGNETFTRVLTTNNSGRVGITQSDQWVGVYGLLDMIQNNKTEADGGVPSTQEVQVWAEMSAGALENSAPAPVRLRIPESTTLLPTAPWGFEELIPGAVFTVDMSGLGLCRTVTDPHKINTVQVTETVEQGEVVTFSADSASRHMLVP